MPLCPRPEETRVPTSFEKSNIHFLLLEGIHASAEQVIRQAGYTHIESHRGALPEAELISRLAGVHVLGIRSRTPLSAQVLAQAPQLMAIGCFCTGTNQVDLQAARDRGIVVFNAPYANTDQIVQTAGHVAILVEMNHDVRIIRLSGAHPPAGVRLWMGDSIGHWEGETLVGDHQPALRRSPARRARDRPALCRRRGPGVRAVHPYGPR